MIDLGDRRILDDGTVICRENSIMEMLFAGRDIRSALAEPSDDVALHNASDRYLDTNYGDIESAHGEIYGEVDWSSHWLTPEPWASMDVDALCMERCRDDRERTRTKMEMDLFRERDMIPVLRHLLYLVDHWRERGILWGVGRGSSVSSFVLHLIGINRINPLDFDLDIGEFLK